MYTFRHRAFVRPLLKTRALWGHVGKVLEYHWLPHVHVIRALPADWMVHVHVIGRVALIGWELEHVTAIMLSDQ